MFENYCREFTYGNLESTVRINEMNALLIADKDHWTNHGSRFSELQSLRFWQRAKKNMGHDSKTWMTSWEVVPSHGHEASLEIRKRWGMNDECTHCTVSAAMSVVQLRFLGCRKDHGLGAETPPFGAVKPAWYMVSIRPWKVQGLFYG